jgi:hypothetical protein
MALIWLQYGFQLSHRGVLGGYSGSNPKVMEKFSARETKTFIRVLNPDIRHEL